MENAVCKLCPHLCSLKEGEAGKCLARSAKDGKVILSAYGEITTIAVEPIEKKPIYHYKPGLKVLSAGGFGCTMSCDYCVPGNTLISTPNGLKMIDQILVGEDVFAVDSSTGTPQRVQARVDHVFCRESEEVLELEIDGQTIQVTREHPILTRRGWVEAQYLTTDDEVLCDKNDLVLSRLQSQIAKNQPKKTE